ncbi:MAG: MBL fold metallo-hydrolase [Candidatus Micrarchaeaceae archaeon]
MAVLAGGHKIALDRHEPDSDLNFVSHAHSDHTSGIRKGKGTLASGITKALLECRGKKITDAEIPKGVRLLNAGHMLGSRQLYAESESSGFSIVYTGDYLMQESYAAEPIEIKEADVLLIDSTYPHPGIAFEDRNEVISAIQFYASYKAGRGIVLFGAYSMGKAQELVKILNEKGIVPFVDEKIGSINKIYQSFGVKLEWNQFSEMRNENFVGIVSMPKLAEMKLELEKRTGRRVFTAVATGWAKVTTFNTDVQFALSDHADFSQALEYIDICNPKLIYTIGSNSGTFAMFLQRHCHKASPLFQGAIERLGTAISRYK